MSLLVYGAGCMMDYYINNEYAKATEWRQYAKKKFEDVGIRFFDTTQNSLEHFKFPKEYSRGIPEQNYVYLSHSNLVLLNLEDFDKSLGSIWETSIASHLHIPVIAFGKFPKWEGRPHYNHIITIQTDTVGEATDYIISMYNQKI